MAYDPVASAIQAIVTHLTSALSGVANVRRGWPEANTALDLSTLPTVTVTRAGRARVELISPHRVDATGGATLTTTYKVGMLTIPVQVDLWAAGYRARADDATATLLAACHNQIPNTTGLWLTTADYYSRPIAVTWSELVADADGDTAATSEWRRTLTGEIVTDLVVQTTHPKLASAVLQHTTALGDVEVTEPDVTVTV